MPKLKEAMDLITLIRKVREGMAQPEKVDDLNLGTAAALLAFNKLSLYSDNLIDILHEYVELKEPRAFVLGEEVLCPDGVGRVAEIVTGPGPRIRVDTYINNRSCLWDVQNIKRWPQR
jgi:hypothetical protein